MHSTPLFYVQVKGPTYGLFSHRKRYLRRRSGGMVCNHSNQKGYVRTDIDYSEDENFHRKLQTRGYSDL